MSFDVLWHDGHDVSPRTYDDRRALLDALALEGPSRRTPRRFCAARDDLAAITRDHQLEAVGAKRRDAPYAPGRRCDAWITSKHRHRKRLHAIAWLPARGSSRRDGLLVARVDEHGRLTPAGVVQLGLAGERPVSLQQLAGVSRTDRRLPLAGVLVDVDHHGPRGGPLRDAVLGNAHPLPSVSESRYGVATTPRKDHIEQAGPSRDAESSAGLAARPGPFDSDPNDARR